MKKKVLSFALAGLMALGLFGCGGEGGSASGSNGGAEGEANSDIKVGVILLGDDAESYTAAHIQGIEEAVSNLGLSEDKNIIWKYNVPEEQECYEAAVDLVASGCDLVISNSYGHQTFMVQAAAEYPDVQFVSMTGDFAAICGLDNMKNAFTNIYEARYVSGVVAGLKLQELVETGELTQEKHPESFDGEGNIKVGYVGAYNYAEVVSGYTAFFLGIRSVMPNVVMEVNYTNSWFDIDKEGAAAEALIANGCVIIGQHADSTGAPAATEKEYQAGKLCFSVGYNVDMQEAAPDTALTSATNNWGVYYTYAIETVMNGGQIDTDWAKGYADGAVGITELSPACAEGTAEYVEEVENQLRDGTLHVFDTSKYTVDGQQVTSDMIDLSYMDTYEGETKEAIQDGYFAESTLRSAPYFAERIDGITEDAPPAQ